PCKEPALVGGAFRCGLECGQTVVKHSARGRRWRVAGNRPGQSLVRTRCRRKNPGLDAKGRPPGVGVRSERRRQMPGPLDQLLNEANEADGQMTNRQMTNQRYSPVPPSMRSDATAWMSRSRRIR